MMMSITFTPPSAAAAPAGQSLDQRRLKQRIAERLQQGVYGQFRRYGLRRDLQQKLAPPSAKIPIAVRPLLPADLDILLPLQGGPASEQNEIIWRRDFYRQKPEGCYVAVDLRDDSPCYMQWLLGANDNRLIATIGGFPALAQNEALLEHAYTPPSHRGLGIMSSAMALIAERAADIGARHVLTFVEEKNIASLKGCHRAGFSPHLLHRRTQIGFGTFVRHSFKSLPENDPRRTMRF